MKFKARLFLLPIPKTVRGQKGDGDTVTVELHLDRATRSAT